MIQQVSLSVCFPDVSVKWNRHRRWASSISKKKNGTGPNTEPNEETETLQDSTHHHRR